MTSRTVWGVVLAVVILALPFMGVDDYYLHLLIMAGLFFLMRKRRSSSRSLF